MNILNKILIITFFINSTILITAPVFPEAQKKGISLKRLADETKYTNGMLFLNLKKYDKALLEFKEYLEIYPEGIHRMESYRNIAEIYLNKYNFIKALNTYRTLYEEFSNTREGNEAYLNMGICYIKMGYYNKAENIFRKITELSTDPSIVKSALVQLDLIEIINN